MIKFYNQNEYISLKTLIILKINKTQAQILSAQYVILWNLRWKR
jgi:hypothetical protein